MDGLLKGDPKGRKKVDREGVKRFWATYGADPGALTPVRLTRLPGCTRGGNEQRLIYLNPHPKSMHPTPTGGLAMKRIVDLVPRRSVEK
jgi:hypothetical protein